MNPDDITAKYGGTLSGASKTTVIAPTTGDFSSLTSKYGGSITPPKAPIAPYVPPTLNQREADVGAKNRADLWTNLMGLGSDLSGRANNIADTFRQGMNGQVQSPIESLNRGGHIAAQATAGIGDIFVHGVRALTDIISNEPVLQNIASSKGGGAVLDYIHNAMQEAGDESSQAQAQNPTTQKVKAWAAEHPQVSGFIKDLGTVAGNVGGIEAAPEAGGVIADTGKALKPAIEGVATEASNIVSDAGQIAKNTAKSATSGIVQKGVDIAKGNEMSAWQKPTEVAGPGYKKATAIYDNAASRGHDISETLVNNGVKLSENIETGATGKKVYNTLDAADSLHADAAKMSNDMLRPALEKADAAGLPRTPVHELINDSVTNIQKNRTLTFEAKDRMIENLEQTRASLEKQFPDGMSLTDLHDEKITRDLNAKYSPVGDIATNMEAVKNKSVADAARKMVETKAPEGIPVKEFNAELAKQHQAANYLEALHGKTVPQTILSKLARWSAKAVGAGAGGALGGGIMGELAGYHLGGIVESLIEKVPASARSMILDNLKTTNPEAFKKVEDYLSSNLSNKGPATNMTNKNIHMDTNKPQFTPKSKTGQMIQSAVEKYKSIPNKEGGFASIGGKTFKEIPEATKKEMIQAIDYIRLGKEFDNGMEFTISKLNEKYNINQDAPAGTIANFYEKLIEETKTSQAVKLTVKK